MDYDGNSGPWCNPIQHNFLYITVRTTSNTTCYQKTAGYEPTMPWYSHGVWQILYTAIVKEGVVEYTECGCVIHFSSAICRLSSIFANNLLFQWTVYVIPQLVAIDPNTVCVQRSEQYIRVPCSEVWWETIVFPAIISFCGQIIETNPEHSSKPVWKST